jgi:hypothetical protein
LIEEGTGSGNAGEYNVLLIVAHTESAVSSWRLLEDYTDTTCLRMAVYYMWVYMNPRFDANTSVLVTGDALRLLLIRDNSDAVSLFRVAGALVILESPLIV